MIALDLARGPFLVPVLVRAVRAVGVDLRLDVDRLAQAARVVEAVARAWQDGTGPEPLRVEVDRRDGALALVFRVADEASASLARAVDPLPRGGEPVPGLAVAMAGAESGGWSMSVRFG